MPQYQNLNETYEQGYLPTSFIKWECYSVTKSCPTLWPHELQYANLPSPSLSTWVWSNSCPLSRWCHPTISFSVVPFSSCPQSFLASESFPMSLLFASGGQSIGASASALLFPMYQGWFLLGLTCSPRDSQESSPAPQFKSINYLVLSLPYGPPLISIHDY